VNTATVTAPNGTSDPNTGNNSSTDTDSAAPMADLSITKDDGVTTILTGNGVTYTYTVTLKNNGPSDAQDVKVADTWPAAFTQGTVTPPSPTTVTQGANGSFTWNVGTLSAGTTLKLTATFTVGLSVAPGSYTNTVDASASTPDPTPGNNKASDTDTVISTAGQILATGTTCDDYVHGNATAITRVDYQVKSGKINNTSPGVFFYYTGLSGALKTDGSGNLTFTITQVNDNSAFPLFQILNGTNNVQVYSVNVGADGKFGTADDTCTTYNGPGLTEAVDSTDTVATISIQNGLPNTYFLASTKYQTSNVVGTKATNQVVTYNFFTNLNGTPVETDLDGVKLAPKGSTLAAVQSMASPSAVSTSQPLTSSTTLDSTAATASISTAMSSPSPQATPVDLALGDVSFLDGLVTQVGKARKRALSLI
jgi:hypothetical protein